MAGIYISSTEHSDYAIIVINIWTKTIFFVAADKVELLIEIQIIIIKIA